MQKALKNPLANLGVLATEAPKQVRTMLGLKPPAVASFAGAHASLSAEASLLAGSIAAFNQVRRCWWWGMRVPAC